MVTSKGLVKEMKEAGFLTLEELRDILSLECNTKEIETLINRLKRDKEYIQFLEGNYKMCSKCKNLFIYSCFHKSKNMLKSECKCCSNKIYKERYGNRVHEYRKRAYLKRKEKGLINQEDINNKVRFTRMKKYINKKLNKKCPDNIINELIYIKYYLVEGTCLKDNIILKMCFNESGQYIGKDRIIEVLKS